MKSALLILALLSLTAPTAEARPTPVRNFVNALQHRAVRHGVVESSVTPTPDPISTPRFRRECDGNKCRLVPVK